MTYNDALNILESAHLSSKERHSLRGQLRRMTNYQLDNWYNKFNKMLGVRVGHLVQTEKKFASKQNEFLTEKKIRRNSKAEVITTKIITED